MRIETMMSYSFANMGCRNNMEDCRYPAVESIPMGQCCYIVCDGVGGANAGEVASATVCNAISEAMAQYRLPDADFTDTDLAKVIGQAYDTLDNIATDENRDMGTTLAMAVFHHSGVMLVHIGDSRILHLRRGKGIVYRSEDHSVVAQMVKLGIISAHEAAEHPQRHVITRCMGPKIVDKNRDMATVMHTDDVLPGDVFLLCTDGVSDFVQEETILEILLGNAPLGQRVAKLDSLSKYSYDNNTAIVVEIGKVEKDKISQASNYLTDVKFPRFSTSKHYFSNIFKKLSK